MIIMNKPILYKITYDQYIDLINQPMLMLRGRFHYEDNILIPTHLEFNTQNELTLFLLSWQPLKSNSISQQTFGRVLRSLDINSMYPAVFNTINIDEEN